MQTSQLDSPLLLPLGPGTTMGPIAATLPSAWRLAAVLCSEETQQQ